MKHLFKNEKGITILALIVTIIVLLILAGITIGNLTGRKSTILRAREAADSSEVASERTIVTKASTSAAAKNKRGFITKEGLEKALQTYNENVEVKETQDHFIVEFKDTSRAYLVDEFGNAEYIEGVLLSANPKSKKTPLKKINVEISLILTVEEYTNVGIKYEVNDNKDIEPSTYDTLSVTKDTDEKIWRGNIEIKDREDGEYYIHLLATIDGEQFKETYGPYTISNTSVLKEITDVRLAQTSFGYDGEEKKPEAIVKYEGVRLTKDTDYTVTYEDNIEPGTGKAIITGIGDYTGTVTKTFTITTKQITDAILAQTEFTYDGEEKTPEATVKSGNTILNKNTDYEITYENNIEIGTAKAIITGKGEYTGIINRSFTIEGAKVTVTFDSNSGTGTMSPQEFTQGLPKAISANTFTKEGYEFVGWAETATGEKKYNDKGQITVNANMTLYALWEYAELRFADQTITKSYSTAAQTANVTPATNGSGSYSYTKKSGEDNITVSTAGVITIPASKAAGTYTIVITARDTVSGRTKDATYTIKIEKISVAEPSNVQVSTAGIVTWDASSDANGYEISIDNTNWTSATSGINYLNTIIATEGNRTIYVRGVNSDTTSYTSPSTNATKQVTVYKVTFASADETKGTVSPSTYNVISGATFETNGNILTIKGITTGTTTVSLKEVTATAKPGQAFINWSKTSGTITAAETITASWQEVYLTTYGENTSTGKFLNTTLTRNKIKKISFSNTVSGHTVDGTNCFDVSSIANSKAVLLWIANTDGDGNYEVVIGQDGGVIANPNSSYLFAHIGNSINAEIDLSNLNTSKATNTSYMFYSCKNVNSLNVSGFNTSKVTSMRSMFSGCSSLTSIDVSGFDASKVTNMAEMFTSCTNLTNINFTGFNTSSATNMSSMFYYDENLEELDLSSFNTQNVNNMRAMFSYCFKLSEVNLSSFDTRNVIDMGMMFWRCRELTELNLSSFNTPKATNMYFMFAECVKLEQLNISNYNTENVTNMAQMFSGCQKLTTLDLSNFNTGNVTDMSSMFSNCRVLSNLNISSFRTPKVTDMNNMFHNCYVLQSIDLSEFDMTTTTNVANMLAFVSALKELKTPKTWYTNDLTIELPKTLYAETDGTAYTSLTKTAPTETWLRIQSTVTFEYNGATGGNTETSKKVATGGTYGTLPLPTKAGYAFAGWYKEEGLINKIEESTVVTIIGDHSIYAKWSEVTLTTYGESASTGKFLNTTLTRDKIKKVSFANSISGHTVDNTNCFDVSSVEGSKAVLLWIANTDGDGNIEVVIGQEGGVIANPNSSYLFAAIGYSIPAEINVTNFNTSKVTNMNYMFNACKNITTLNLNSFDTSHVTNLIGTFTDCTGLTTLNVNLWDVSNVIYMGNTRDDLSTGGTFVNCSSIETLNLSNWNTSNVIRMNTLFKGCTNLKNLDITNFDTSKVTGMMSMFSGCKSLETLDLSMFNTEQVWNMSSMFSSCEVLKNLNISTFNTSKVTWMSAMFSSCGIEELDLSHFDVRKVTTMNSMFQDDHYIKQLDLSTWQTDSLTTMTYMFYKAYAITDIDMSNFNTSKVSGFGYLFADCKSLINLDISSFNTENVTDISRMFSCCNSIETIDLTHFNTPKLKNMWQAFAECNYLTSINLSSFNTEQVNNMGGLFYKCYRLPEVDLSSFNTSSATSLSGMFNGCTSIEFLDLSNFNTSNVQSMDQMFYDCGNLKLLNITSFDTSNVTTMHRMFINCTSLNTLDLSSFNTSNVTNMDTMFHGCGNLKRIYAEETFATTGVTLSAGMFNYCTKLVGGKGTAYNASYTNIDRACIDTVDHPGYFTAKSDFTDIQYGDRRWIDPFGNTVVIPKQFKMIDTFYDEIVPRGLVISDQYENEFVWIPVGDVADLDRIETIEMGRYQFNAAGEKSEYTGSMTEDASVETFVERANAMGGYFLGRYEARTETSRSASSDTLTVATEKADHYVYNFVTRAQALQLAKEMYHGSMISDLTNSYAWDTATLFLQTFDNRSDAVKVNTNYNEAYSRQNRYISTWNDKGTNNISNERYIDKICNVYDFATNNFEWSTETGGATYSSVSRGGCSNSDSYTNSRDVYLASYSNKWSGFRLILYFSSN